MAQYVFDTNIISFILRRDSQIIARLNTILTPTNTIIGCPVVWYEIRRGLLATSATAKLQRFEILFATFIWRDLSKADWDLAATLWAQRRSQGHPIEDADLLIGVFASNHGAILVTDNTKDFTDLNIQTESWR